MNRTFRSVRMTAVVALMAIAIVMVGAAIGLEFNSTTMAASPAEKAQEAAKNETVSREQLAAEMTEVKAALDNVQENLGKGDIKAVETDAKRLRNEFNELTEVCARWQTDLNRLETDAGKLFEEWTTVVDGIQDPQNRVREAERLARSKARFRKNLLEAQNALAQAKEALAAYGDVAKILKSAAEFAAQADSISYGLATLSASARERTAAFRSATTAVLAAIQKMEGSLLS